MKFNNYPKASQEVANSDVTSSVITQKSIDVIPLFLSEGASGVPEVIPSFTSISGAAPKLFKKNRAGSDPQAINSQGRATFMVLQHLKHIMTNFAFTI